MPKKTEQFSTHSIHVKQQKRSFHIAKLPASILIEIAYASVRNVDNEEGAVQRLLETGRIKEVKAFALEGGDYPSSIILNWVSKDAPLSFSNGKMSFSPGPRLAQLVDGQHRVEGLREAIKERPEIANMEIPVTVFSNLSTRECADIFISINDKQKQVKKSLVVDLYDVASDYVVDIVAQRARDLAELLHSEETSPYRGYIKFPNAPRGSIGIPLSTVVSNIKPLVEPQGVFEQVGLVELNMQTACIVNFFSVIRKWYGKNWDDRKRNAFLTSAGFTGAIDFLKVTMLWYCNLAKDFTQEHMARALALDPTEIIERDELKGLQGRAAWNKVNQLLKNRFKSPPSTPGLRV